MRVVPIASTSMLTENLYFIDHPYEWQDHAGSIDNLAEFAGRNCYQSWNRPNPATATNEGYLSNILSQEHHSVLEHGSVTFYVDGVSRSLTHELIRHRHLSFSELSQRYASTDKMEYVIPPAIATVGGWAYADIQMVVDNARATYQDVMEETENTGLSMKKRREAARAVLPNCTETKIVVTGNLRAWRDVLKKRHHVAADAEIQLFAKEVLRHLRMMAPNSVQDIPDKPYGSDNA